MHRRTQVLLSPMAQTMSAQTMRGHYRARATTASRACRYRIGLAGNVVPVSTNLMTNHGARFPVANTSGNAHGDLPGVPGSGFQIVAKQFGCSEHQVLGLRTKTQGIVPDVVRAEWDAPSRPLNASASLEHAGVCFLRHFSLAQPYF